MKVMALETPELPTIADLIARYWGHLAAVSAALATIYAAWRKYVRGRIRPLYIWLREVASLPLTLVEIKNELQFENGVSLRQKLTMIGEDLTQLKRIISMETAARRSHLQLAETPMFECNDHGQFLWANDVLLKTVQKSLPQILGSNWKNIIALPDREEFFEAWTHAVAEAIDFSTKFRLTTPDGEQWMFFDAVCIKDDLGNVLSYLGKMKEVQDPRTPKPKDR